MQPSPKYYWPEIERRWLVPYEVALSLAFGRRRLIEDRYVQGTSLRLRAVREAGLDPVYKLGKKYGASASSAAAAVSIYLSEREHELLAQMPGRVARKERREVAAGALDIYESPAHDFCIYEIEFESEQQATSFSPPAFVGQEITGNPAYTGYALALGAA